MGALDGEVEEANPMGTWPGVPYHYGMGRNAAYDQWLGRLDEVERARAIAACRERYEAYYRRSADIMIAKMHERGFDLVAMQQRERTDGRDPEGITVSPPPRPEAERPRRRVFDFDGPTLGGGRKR